MNQDSRTISFRVSPEFARLLRIAAAKLDQNCSTFIRQTLEQRLGPTGTPTHSGVQEATDVRNS
jgi:predicted DNA-binding protein